MTPENTEEVWRGYNFKVDTHYLDKEILSKIKWYSDDDHIDLTEFYARPMIFLKADGLLRSQKESFAVATSAIANVELIEPEGASVSANAADRKLWFQTFSNTWERNLNLCHLEPYSQWAAPCDAGIARTGRFPNG